MAPPHSENATLKRSAFAEPLPTAEQAPGLHVALTSTPSSMLSAASARSFLGKALMSSSASVATIPGQLYLNG